MRRIVWEAIAGSCFFAAVAACGVFVVSLLVCLPWAACLAITGEPLWVVPLAALPFGPIMVGPMVFVAVLILGTRDYLRNAGRRRGLQHMLRSRRDVDDDEFVTHFAEADAELMIQTRHGIAHFFGVSEQKIHPTDNLHDDLQFGRFEPAFHTSVAFHVFAARQVAPQSFAFNTSGFSDIGDLAAEIQRVMDGFDANTEDH